MSVDGTGTPPPTLAELVTAIDEAARVWHLAKAATELATKSMRMAMRHQIEAEQAYRAACHRYEAERVQAS